MDSDCGKPDFTAKCKKFATETTETNSQLADSSSHTAEDMRATYALSVAASQVNAKAKKPRCTFGGSNVFGSITVSHRAICSTSVFDFSVRHISTQPVAARASTQSADRLLGSVANSQTRAPPLLADACSGVANGVAGDMGF